MATLTQNKSENNEREREIEELEKANKALEEAKSSLEAQLQQKTEELEKLRHLTIGRELLMIRLKNDIAKLQQELAKSGSFEDQHYSLGAKVAS